MNIQTNKLPDNPQIQVLKSGKTGLFTNYIFKAIPLAFDESLSYYECLCGLLDYLKNVIIPTVNNNADAVAELQTLYIELKTYVDNAINEYEKSIDNKVKSLENYMNDYFNNLDVQEEINNKLDDMVKDGTLPEIIASYLNSKAIFGFDNVELMKQSTNLINGSYAQTLGYHTKNDGGGSLYKIREITNDDVVDNGSIIPLQNNSLIAELIVNDNTISIKQFGAYGDDIHDDATPFNNLISYINGKYMTLYINKGIYKLNSSITVDWSNPNFNQNFGGSYEIKGAGIFETKLHFSTSNGLLINPNNNTLTIKIHDLCIENSEYNILTETGNERTPNVSKGIGLLVRHIGYMGKVYSVAVKGFYIGIMSKNCYGGPIFENLFVNWCVFGYYSKDDTTIVHNSCSYLGIESCYLQDGSQSTLTNVICEGNQKWFKDDNTYNQRSKFEGRAFSFINNAYVNTFSCYVEDTYGNAIYINNSFIKDINSGFNSFMNYHLTLPEYKDLKNWLDNNPDHNYDDIYVYLTNNTHEFVCFENGGFVRTSTAYVDVYISNNYLDETPNVKFIGYDRSGSIDNNYARFYKGHTKPVVQDYESYYNNNQNFDMLPIKLYGVPNFVNKNNPTNGKGYNSLNVRRIGNFNDTSYNEVNLHVQHNLDGSIRIFKETLLNGTQVTDTEVMRIASDGKVTFPQNI